MKPLVHHDPDQSLLRLMRGAPLDAGRFVTHHRTLDQFEVASDVVARAGETGALEVVRTHR